MTNNPKNDREKKKDLNWNNEADGQLHTSEWFGAILRYLWHLRRRKFDSFYNPKELKKNILIGWLFKVIVVILVIWLAFVIAD